jgi:hypothetical protein
MTQTHVIPSNRLFLYLSLLSASRSITPHFYLSRVASHINARTLCIKNQRLSRIFAQKQKVVENFAGKKKALLSAGPFVISASEGCGGAKQQRWTGAG